MKVLSLTPMPNSECIEPTVDFELLVSFAHGERVPVDFSIVVRAEDRKILGNARSYVRATESLPIDALDSPHGLPEATERLKMTLPLTRGHVEHIERVRSRHRKGDVVLRCEVEGQFLVSATTNATFLLAQRNEGDTYDVKYRYQGSSFRPSHTNMWVLSGNNARTFLKREIKREERAAVIVSSDWLHDYVSLWHATNYLVLEIPHAEATPGKGGLQDWVDAATQAISNARSTLSKGEWNDVVEDLRPVWEVLRGKPDIKAMLEADGYTTDAAAALDSAIRQMFDFASKFVHRTDKTGKRLVPEVRAAKEEAMLVYALAGTVVNLIARKTARQN
jgi:hypothetical protein